jgi:hypothetical protein
MSSTELVEEARRRAIEAKENDRKLGDVLAELLDSIEELGRRLDDG